MVGAAGSSCTCLFFVTRDFVIIERNTIKTMQARSSSGSSSHNSCVMMSLPLLLFQSKEAIRQLMLGFWGHILYSRGQIPLPLDAVLSGKLLAAAIASNNDPSSSMPKMNKSTMGKITKFIARFQSITASLDAVLDNLERTSSCGGGELTVFVIIGASATSPREAFVLNIRPLFPIPVPSYSEEMVFDDADGDSVHGEETLAARKEVLVSKKSIDQAIRVLIRTLISNWDCPAKILPLTNTYIALSAGACEFAYDLSERAASEFTARDGFKLKLRKRSPGIVHLLVRSAEECLPDDHDQCQPINQMLPTEAAWFILKKGVKGIKG